MDYDADYGERDDDGIDASWTKVELYTNIVGTTLPYGAVTGYVRTNDNEDKGFASEYAEWSVFYRSLDQALRHWGGGSHRGINGSQVTVTVDGEERVKGQ